jgi:hypothetical protein
VGEGPRTDGPQRGQGVKPRHHPGCMGVSCSVPPVRRRVPLHLWLRERHWTLVSEALSVHGFQF